MCTYIPHTARAKQPRNKTRHLRELRKARICPDFLAGGCGRRTIYVKIASSLKYSARMKNWFICAGMALLAACSSGPKSDSGSAEDQKPAGDDADRGCISRLGQTSIIRNQTGLFPIPCRNHTQSGRTMYPHTQLRMAQNSRSLLPQQRPH